MIYSFVCATVHKATSNRSGEHIDDYILKLPRNVQSDLCELSVLSDWSFHLRVWHPPNAPNQDSQTENQRADGIETITSRGNIRLPLSLTALAR
jgi:hypothetical protein